ncbi:hypothetical protein [Streptomyces sp. NPDC087270]|uniref:hypothetical protein n=1 Tax=Streptomyces sp. NPDC087270 TaxID=3365774 RepID=UPI00382589A2
MQRRRPDLLFPIRLRGTRVHAGSGPPGSSYCRRKTRSTRAASSGRFISGVNATTTRSGPNILAAFARSAVTAGTAVTALPGAARQLRRIASGLAARPLP